MDPEPRSAHCRGHDVHRLLPEASCGPRQLHHGASPNPHWSHHPLDRQERPSECRTRVVSLSTAERAFRSMKSVDLKVRPISVLLCPPAYYVEWHMRAGAGCYSAMKTTMRAQAAARQPSRLRHNPPSRCVRLPTAPECTASAVCWPTWRRSPAIEFSSANKPLTGWLRRPVQQQALDRLQIRP